MYIKKTDFPDMNSMLRETLRAHGPIHSYGGVVGVGEENSAREVLDIMTA
jgi:hypothetical protein